MALDKSKGTEIKQADLFANVDKSLLKSTRKTDEKEILAEAKEFSTVPDSYVEVKLSSLGKLAAPRSLHFRNYTLEEAAELTDLSQKNQYEVFAKILNGMIYEDFDCSTLHKQEVLEILLTIYATWWSPTIDALPYIVDEKADPEVLNSPENTRIARLHIINDIKTIDLMGEFKSPFKIIGPDNSKYVVRTPQIGDLILAKNYCEIKFAEEEKFFYSLTKKLSKGLDIDPMELNAYQEYLNARSKEGLIVERSCMLVEKDGEVLDDERRLEVGRKLDLPFWNYVSSIQSDHHFGIDPMIKFKDEVTDEYITRRFEFRFLDLFPSMDKKANGGYTVSFD